MSNVFRPIVPFQDLPQQIRSLRPELDAAMGRVVTHGQFILGPEVAAFEQSWANYCGTRHAVGVSSGTEALHLILRALGIGQGDQVITVANTFIATAEAISYSGATPVLVDCLPDTLLMDPAAVEAAITQRTRAVIPVHLYGQPADMEQIGALARKHGLAVIEDAAQAHGATLSDDRRAGALGVAAGFSFYPGKNLGAFGDAGAVTTSDDDLAAKLRLLRNWGSTVKYHHEVAGFNARLDTLQAAVLSVKLPYLETWNQRRRTIATSYREALAALPLSLLPVAPWTGLHAHHLFVVRCEEGRRDALATELLNEGIQTVVHYPIPIHLQKAYAHLHYKAGSFPNAEAAARTVLSLPMFPEMTNDQVGFVAEKLACALSS